MTVIISSPRATEQSTYAVDVSFLDETGAAVTPTTGSVVWTLTDESGSVINARQSVAITAASTVTIVLSGADLARFDNESGVRLITVEALYASSLGSGLTLKDQIQFSLDSLIAV